ncbi:MAG: AraC family transcriptional regulator [Paludibacteraceae bacterium]|nr:AraC family transcriptional regulator [Paludibacteraceae bacterium]
MEAKTYDKERLEAVKLCRELHRLIIDKKLYLQDNISRVELSRMMNVNPDYLYQEIKLGSGFTLRNFIKAIRMNIAYKMLSQTNCNMKIVLAECGYKDKSPFYRAFNERFHCSPTQLRKRYFAN